MMAGNNLNIAALRVACSNCNLRELCLPLGLSLKEIERLEELVSMRHRVRRGDALYRAGDKFDALYGIRLGFLKSAVLSSDGREQVTSFHMSGDIVGLDGLASMVYSSDLIALEDTEVCILPYERLEEISAAMPSMGMHFQRLLSREIVRQNGVMLLLGSMHAEERLAAFILNLSQRFEQRGYSRSEFVLRMTRAEIGSYLGLKLETVSRVMSRFSHDRLIIVNQKHIQIMDFAGLRAIMSGQVFQPQPAARKTVPIKDAGIDGLVPME
ncbi:MAG: fumarate/nitrate reduction transcriptional regulator Fnr [Duodenibacillus sp.]|nr:fumarate/nitrate reduction transcriptional regulator Fnr [Duodenibacillus sp.]